MLKPVTPSLSSAVKTRGKKGKVLAVSPKEGKVIVEGMPTWSLST